MSTVQKPNHISLRDAAQQLEAVLEELCSPDSTTVAKSFLEEFEIVRVGCEVQHPLRLVVGADQPFLLATPITNITDAAATATATTTGTDDAEGDQEQDNHPVYQVPVGSATSEQGPSLGGCNSIFSIPAEPTRRSQLNSSTKQPLTIDNARFLLSVFLMARRNVPNAWPMLAPCDTPTTPVLGASGGSDSCVSLRITNNATRVPIKALPRIDVHVESFVDEHGLNTVQKAQTQAFAVYNLMGVPETSTTETSLSVNYTWSNPSSVMAPPPHAATGQLRIRAIPGDPRSAALPLWRDVHLIQKLEEIRRAIATDTSLQTEPWSVRGEAMLPRVTDFLNDMEQDAGRLPTAATTAPINVGADLNLDQAAPVSLLLSDRMDLDFTEQLWALTKHCNSFSDLRKSMGAVFAALQSGRVQPMLHKTNNSKLAMVARACLRQSRQLGGEDLPTLLKEITSSAAGPVGCLIEIGLAKLRRDYSHHLIGQELITGQQIVHFSCESVSLEEQVARIFQVHSILEVLVVAQGFADLPHDSQRQLVGTAAKFFHAHGSQPTPPVFAITLPAFSTSTSKVRGFCAGAEPALWTLAVSSEGSPDSRLVQFVQSAATFGLPQPEVQHVRGSDGSMLEAATFATIVADSFSTSHQPQPVA